MKRDKTISTRRLNLRQVKLALRLKRALSVCVHKLRCVFNFLIEAGQLSGQLWAFYLATVGVVMVPVTVP